MAFVSGEGMRPSSSSNGIPNGISDQQAQSQDFRAALQQQLMAMQQQQQQQQQATQQAPPPSASQLTGNNLLYQQLLAQQLQNQQPQLSSQTQQPNPQLALQQQLAALQNLSNPSAALLQQQFPGGALGQPAANNGVATALAALIATNPAILQALAGTAATTPNTLSLLMQLLMPNAASNLVQPQQQSLLSLIQLLTNPASALLNYPSLLQQPLHQAQPAQQVNQLSALTQLLGANAGGNNANWHQLSAALGGAGAVPNTTNSTDESRAYLDQLLRQVQEQQHQQQQQPQQQQAQQQHPQPVAASNNNTPRPMLSAQNSSSSLLGNVQHSASTSNNSLTSNNSAAPNRESALQQVQLMDTTGPLSSNESANYNRSNERQPSSERLLNAESVQDHITRLINENEAIVEPNPVLLKRRPYNRTNTSNSIASQSSVNDNGSQRGSPSIRSPGLQTRVPTTRSQSLHEASMLNTFRAAGGSLTSGQPVFRPSDRYPQQLSSLTCNFCGLKFPNEAGLEAHEFRCSKKEQLTKQHSQPQLQLHSISAQSQVQQQVQLQAQLLLLQQQKAILNAQQQQQSFMAANAAGITADSVSGRSSAPDSPSGSHKLGFQPVHSSSPSSMENRHPLKKRLLEAAAKEAEIVDVVSINEPQTSAKMPKMAEDGLNTTEYEIHMPLLNLSLTQK